MSVAEGDDEATHVAYQWAGDVEETLDSAKTLWEKRFANAFTPGNGYFSGNLPVLTTPDEAFRHMYYMSILSSELLMMRTNFTLQPRIFVTAATQYGLTLMYFWDGAMGPVLTALLDPVIKSTLSAG